MPTPDTDPQIIAQETRLVRQLARLPYEAEVELIDTGVDSSVYIVSNGKYVCKFPRRPEIKQEYQRERKILELLVHIESPVTLPRVLWTHPDNNYLGYAGIIGTPFDQIADSTSAATKQHIGRDMGEFLQQLHSLPFSGGKDMDIAAEIAKFQAKYRLAVPVISKNFSKDEQVKLETFVLQELPSRLNELGANTVTCHGDLGYWNMIWEDNHNSVGVIDFGDVGQCDQSRDFMGLPAGEMLNAALSVYGDTPLLRQKIELRQKGLLLMDLGYYVSIDDQAGIAKTLPKLKKP